MSTILKALRRLEEDKPGKAKSSNEEVAANAEAVSADSAPARPPEARPTARRAPTDPRATDELRERILAEERVSEAMRIDHSRAGSRERAEAIAASASIAGTFAPALDPFASRVVEPAFAPPSSAKLGHTHSGMDSASPSNTSAGATGLLSRGLMVVALGLGFVVVFLAGFLYSGQSGTTGAEPTRAAAQVASASIPSADVSAASVRPMTVTRSKVAPRPEAPRQAAAPKPRLAPRAAFAAELAEAEPSNELASAAVTPTLAARETIREPARQAPADSAVASSPRAQTFSGDGARVSAAAPSKTSAPPEPVRVAPTAATASAEQLPMPEIAASRSVRTLPEATSSARIVVPEAPTRAGVVRPSEKPAAEVAQPAASSRSAAAPAVALVESRGLPDLTVIRTSWHPTADRRSAKIRLEEKNELVTLREGDSVGGMVIHEISPSAVIFSTGEVQILRRVGEASFGR